MPTPTPALPAYADGATLQSSGTNCINDLYDVTRNLYSDTQSGFRTLKPLCVAFRILTPGGPSNAIDTVTAWDQVTANSDNFWSAGQSYEKLTVQTSGWYRCALQVHWDATPGGIRSAKILVNGTSASNAVAADSRNAATGGEGTTNFCAATVYLSAGAVVYGSIYQNSGGQIPTITTFGGSFLTLEWVSN